MNQYIDKKRITQIGGLALATALISPTVMAEVSGEIGVTNDYRFRAISQSAGDAALQAGIDWSHDSGFYVGAWGSNVDFDDPEAGNGADIEVDLYAGYAGAMTEDLEYDFTIYAYTYPGDDVSQNYLEASLGLYYADFHAAYWYTNDYANSDLDYHYTEVNYAYGFADNWSLDLHLGYSFGDANEIENDGFDKYIDYSVGVSTEVSGFGLSLAWLDTDIDSELEVTEGSFKSKGTLLASISYAF